MWFRRLCAAMIVGSLVLLPVVAADDSMEVDYETVTDSSPESGGDAVSPDSGIDVPMTKSSFAATKDYADGQQVQLVPDQYGNIMCGMDNIMTNMSDNEQQQSQRDETINNNLSMLVGCIMACGGMLIGYWTGSDLLSIWHK